MVREMFRGIDLLNAAEFQEIRSRMEAAPTPLPEAELLQRVAAHAKIDAALYLFQVRRANGDVIFRSDNMGRCILPSNPDRVQQWTYNCESGGAVRVSEFREGSLIVQIASPLRNVDHLFRSYFEGGLLVMGMVLVMSIFFGLWLKEMALAPIRRIQKTAALISADNLSERIPTGRGNDEVTDLARLLNQMFDRLEKIVLSTMAVCGKRFARAKDAAVDHPVAIREAAHARSLSGAQQESVQQQLESISRLATVIEKLLFLARSEVGAIYLNLKAQCTGTLIKAFSEDAVVLCEEAKCSG